MKKKTLIINGIEMFPKTIEKNPGSNIYVTFYRREAYEDIYKYHRENPGKSYFLGLNSDISKPDFSNFNEKRSIILGEYDKFDDFDMFLNIFSRNENYVNESIEETAELIYDYLDKHDTSGNKIKTKSWLKRTYTSLRNLIGRKRN